MKIHYQTNFGKYACVLLTSILTFLLVLQLPTVGQAQTITGTVYRDFNANGIRTATPASGTYTYGEPGVPGVIVTAYSSNSTAAPISATTNATGGYTLTVGNTNAYRLEFTNFVSGDFDGFIGADSRSNIQFVNGGATTVDFGINYPAQYCGIANPYLATSCYTNGDPIASPSSSSVNPANDGWMVGWQYDGASTNRNVELSAGKIGSTWGLAYHRTQNLLFAAAFMKRHAGFGTGGPGQIYTINMTNPLSASTTPAVFVNLQTDLGIAVGTDPRIATPLPTNKTTANHDAAAFDLVGKMSLGDIDISDDDRTLWVMNLFDQALYELPIGSPATKPTTYTKHILPSAGCTNGTLRPFATKYYRGKVYIGAVCSAEASGGTAANLKALVYEHDPAGATSNFTQVLTFPLNFTRGYAGSRGTNPGTGPAVLPGEWRPWIDQWTDIPSNLLLGAYTQTVCPQPVLSDIEFDVNGEMILGFFDRFAHQSGNNNYTPVTSSTLIYEAVGVGDIMRAGRKADGTYLIENNATVINIPANGAPAVTVSSSAVGQVSPQGPGGGEFYWQDMYTKDATPNSTTTDGGHQEVLVGGLSMWPGSGEVVSTAYDPFTNYRAAGARYFNNVTGNSDFEYQVITQDGGLADAIRAATFGKAASLGDLEILCDPSPIQIGNRVWKDTDNDGVQDPGEPVLAGVTVLLKGPGLPAVGVSVTTDANGEYYFSNATGTNATGFVYSLTGLTAGGSYSLTFPLSASAGALTLSGKSNAATGTTADRIDTDPNLAGLISFTLGQAGENNFTYDAAYVAPASLGDYVFVDTNKDGIQNTGDVALPGVKVTLYQNGSAVATTTTNASGLYSFTGLTPASSVSYSVGFTTPTGYTATISNVGSDTADSDASPTTGLTQSVTLAPGENNPTLDAGFYLLPASLGDYVFLDANKDGIQNTGDTPIPGVTVTLFRNGSAVASTTTDVNGLYSFTGLTPGTSNSYVVGFTAPAGYTATISNVGSDTADSDADPITGKTQSVTLAPGEYNPTLDAGFFLPTASLGDYTFIDTNKDGIQNAGDVALPGVTVTLFQNGSAVASTTTDANGLYSFTGLAPGMANSYVVGFTTPAGYTATLSNVGSDTADSDASPVTGKTQSVTLAPGEYNPTLDAGFYLQPASLGDYVFLDANKDGIQNAGDSPMPGVTVTLFLNGSAVATTTTNASGLYSFTGLAPGTSNSYVVGFTAPAGYTATLSNVGSDTADSDADPITGKTQSVTLAPGEYNPTLDAGFYLPTAGLGDYVFEDKNANGIQDAGDLPIPGVLVTLYTNGSAVATTTTNANGLYSFTGLTPATPYVVGFGKPAGYVPTLVNVGNDALDSDAALATGLTGVYSLTADEFNPTVDAGFYKLASLGDYVFNDKNRDGIQNAGDSPIPGVTVTLYQNGSAVATTTTDANGLYSFTGLTPGTSNSYVVGFTPPSGYSATSPLSGTDATKDSNADPITGRTSALTLASGENNPTIDAGFYQPTASLGNFVFEDVNKDGLQDAGDIPIAGAVVTLLQSGTLAGTTTTDANGIYSFTGLTPGIPYSVSFTTPVGFSAATTSNVGSNDAIDSDPVGGVTAPVTLTAGENNPTLDAGFVKAPTLLASLGNFVFEDVNKDGLQDAGDIPIAGAVVTLLQSGTVAGTTTTNASGIYSFTGLTPGIPYSVSFTTPAGFSAATASNVGSNDAIDSDPVGGVTAPVTLTAGENNPTLDAGFVRPASLPATFALAKTVNKKRIEKGGIVTYTISVTNTSAVTATNVLITDAFSTTGLTIIGSATTSAGTFIPSLTGGSWSIPTLAASQTATISFLAQANEEGLAYNVVTAPDGTTASACLTVPFQVCANSEFEFLLSVPTSFSTYQWSLNGTPIPGATSASYSATAVGEYTVASTNTAGCPDGSCCPFVIEAIPAPSLTARAVAATCNSSLPLNDASITLVGSSTNAVSYNITLGSSFTTSAPLFATNQPLAGVVGGVLKAGLANPVLAPGNTYTIRVYSAEGCFSDTLVVVPPAQCNCPAPACVPFTVRKVARR